MSSCAVTSFRFFSDGNKRVPDYFHPSLVQQVINRGVVTVKDGSVCYQSQCGMSCHLQTKRLQAANVPDSLAMRLSAPADYSDLLAKYDTWMFDCDGVIWRGDQLIDGAIDVLNILRIMSMDGPFKLIFVAYVTCGGKKRKCYSSPITPRNPGRSTRANSIIWVLKLTL